MLVRVISPLRWTAEGVAGALVRTATPGSLQARPGTPDEALAIDGATPDLVVVVGAQGTDARHILDRLPPALPLLWLGEGFSDTAASDGRPQRALAQLPADTDEARLQATVAALALGLSVYDSAGAAPRRPSAAEEAADELSDPLTPRELEVFELMAKGLGNRDIANALGISSHTAKFHVAQILEKTGSATRTEAVRQGLRLGIVGL